MDGIDRIDRIDRLAPALRLLRDGEGALAQGDGLAG